jgi:hypothetical protein
LLAERLVFDFFLMADFGFVTGWQGLANAHAAARKALKFDPQSSVAHAKQFRRFDERMGLRGPWLAS